MIVVKQRSGEVIIFGTNAEETIIEALEKLYAMYRDAG